MFMYKGMKLGATYCSDFVASNISPLVCPTNSSAIFTSLLRTRPTPIATAVVLYVTLNPVSWKHRYDAGEGVEGDQRGSEIRRRGDQADHLVLHRGSRRRAVHLLQSVFQTKLKRNEEGTTAVSVA